MGPGNTYDFPMNFWLAKHMKYFGIHTSATWARPQLQPA
jgi:hypothetical protein